MGVRAAALRGLAAAPDARRRRKTRSPAPRRRQRRGAEAAGGGRPLFLTPTPTQTQTQTITLTLAPNPNPKPKPIRHPDQVGDRVRVTAVAAARALESTDAETCLVRPYLGQCGLLVQDDGDRTPFKASLA